MGGNQSRYENTIKIYNRSPYTIDAYLEESIGGDKRTTKRKFTFCFIQDVKLNKTIV